MPVDLNTKTTECVGKFTESLAKLARSTGCTYAPGPIFIGPENIRHIESKHTYDFDKYFAYVGDIISNPDYVGVQPDDGSLRLIKRLGENVMVLVRITRAGNLYVRSLYCIKEDKLRSYINAGSVVAAVQK